VLQALRACNTIKLHEYPQILQSSYSKHQAAP
jgi:hypothetical protein